ncbi:B-cell antigen receptor complex-associated protein alpha chain [Colossoma macropomum]|uniref:B-cell antigen receptor complex-associated protein alpha chain n=1 Tax=Colossoma macropomum TaxID=42526 RepID=UPI00186409F3|nr:B-cell antigen receptor complex-associated protein alpha chain [Colossoma macropomum]
MEARMVFLFCFLAVDDSAAQAKTSLMDDQPSLRIPVSETATMQCCYKGTPSQVTWSLTVMTSHGNSTSNQITLPNERMKVSNTFIKETEKDVKCSSLELKNVSKTDIGLYSCTLNLTQPPYILTTPGTFLQVFEPIRKTLNISETTKNSIITVQGVFLLFCVLIPGTMLICKSRGLHELEKRKGKEEENIYEGLNLDDCTSTYHQIQRSQVQGPYQDVVNTVEDDILLEKP